MSENRCANCAHRDDVELTRAGHYRCAYTGLRVMLWDGDICRGFRQRGQRTVRVTIAVAVDESGNWTSDGDANGWMDEGELRRRMPRDGSCVIHRVEASVPIPVVHGVEGEVCDA